MPDDEDLVTVRGFLTISEAETARMALVRAGIPCVLLDALHTSLASLGQGVEMRLQVARADAERAQEVLRQSDEPSPQELLSAEARKATRSGLLLIAAGGVALAASLAVSACVEGAADRGLVLPGMVAGAALAAIGLNLIRRAYGSRTNGAADGKDE